MMRCLVVSSVMTVLVGGCGGIADVGADPVDSGTDSSQLHTRTSDAGSGARGDGSLESSTASARSESSSHGSSGSGSSQVSSSQESSSRQSGASMTGIVDSGEPESGSDGGGCSPAVAVAGAACTAGVTSASNQPSNPCGAGYVWTCDQWNPSFWIQESLVCNEEADGSIDTATCGPGEVLLVLNISDSANGLCGPGNDGGLGPCYTDVAYCVPIPSSCTNGLDCACGTTVCHSACNGFSTLREAGGGVIECACT
jgi:hypothetical protein